MPLVMLSGSDGVEIDTVNVDDAYWASSEPAIRARVAQAMPDGFYLEVVVPGVDEPERRIACEGDVGNWLQAVTGD